MTSKHLNVESAMLQPGRQTNAASNISVLPAAEMPMVLTLDQLSPYQHNPRTSRNPRYQEIKASIQARGLDTVLKVTRDPDEPSGNYTFSDGGNTRYQILTELWHETSDDRFYRFHVLFKPWPGHIHCLLGHLAKDEARGELSFIEKAIGIHKARIFHEEKLQHPLSIRELADLLTQDGLPISHSSVSRMENALKHLYPWMPELLESGLGRPQITALLSLRQDAEKIWDEFVMLSGSDKTCFSEVFGECCRRFNAPDLWALEMFRDEFIGDLLQALPHPGLNYDRWLMELDPKERNRRHHYGEPITATDNPEPQPDTEIIATPAHCNNVSTKPIRSVSDKPLSPPSINADEITRLITHQKDDQDDLALLLTYQPEVMEAGTPQVVDEDIWHIPPHQNDIEHLQGVAFRLAWELAEALGCENEILPDRENDFSAGYRGDSEDGSVATCFLLSLAGLTPEIHPIISWCGMYDLFIGGTKIHEAPALLDEGAMKLLRLMRVLRRLRELQRALRSGEVMANE
nr:ParB family protein [Pantoea cypripedii]